MPIYDFKCPSCGKKYSDYLLGLSEPLPMCKKCKVTLEKLMVVNAKMSENWGDWQREGGKK